MKSPHRFLTVLLAVIRLIYHLKADIVINEAMYSPSTRQLNYLNAASGTTGTGDPGLATLGSGLNWYDAAYSDTHWTVAGLPAGFGPYTLDTPTQWAQEPTRTTTLAKDWTAEMKNNNVPSLYLRKKFTVSATDAGRTEAIQLRIDYDDAFIAYLNGREIMRRGAGSKNSFVYADQPVTNLRMTNGFEVIQTSTGLTGQSIIPANTVLVSGENILAIHVINSLRPPSGNGNTNSNDDRNRWDGLSRSFFINAGLEIATTSPTILLATSGSGWSQFVGRYEPSGGVVDPGLLNANLAPLSNPEDEIDTDTNEFVDWVELHNNGTTAVNLTNWALSDEADTPLKWRFPTGTSIPAGGYLLVLCDGLGDLIPSANPPLTPQRLHTNFSLKDDGESIYLRDASGVLKDQFLSVPKQTFFASWGRQANNATQIGYLRQASPSAANLGTVELARADSPKFLKQATLPLPTDPNAAAAYLPGGFYEGAQTLYLISETPGAQIYYTRDGSEPTTLNGILYTGAIGVSPFSANNNKRGTVIRARAYGSGLLPSGVNSETYLLTMDPKLKSVPAVCLSGQNNRIFYKPHGVMAINGGTTSDTISGFYSSSSGQANQIWTPHLSTSASYTNRLTDPQAYNMPNVGNQTVERETHLELYPPTGYYPNPDQQPLNVDLGLRVSSSPYSRPRLILDTAESSIFQSDGRRKPSFNLTFRNDFGPGRLDYPVFPNYTIKNFNSLRLRAGKNDIKDPFIVDELARRLWIDMGHVGAKGMINTLFINGILKGYYNLTERYREELFQEHYRSANTWEVRYVNDWVDGTPDGSAPPAWTEFYNDRIDNASFDVSTLTNYNDLRNRADVVNFADYLIYQTYNATWDWPENNYVIYREQNSTTADAKFRFAPWDVEGAYFNQSYFSRNGRNKDQYFNTLKYDIYELGFSADVPNIYKKLRDSSEWRLLVADRINKHFFNQETLDDRDPDGSGALTSKLYTQHLSLYNEINDVFKSVNSVSSNTKRAYIDTWLNPTNGRRKNLFEGVNVTVGSVTTNRTYGIFRDPNEDNNLNDTFWPLTEPPIFSQHGGNVPTGFNLTMSSIVAGGSGQVATIYYTTNGADPRIEFTGAVNTAGGAQTYTAAVPINGIIKVKARARNNTTQEWSALTEADFEVNTAPATAANLVVAEVMYNPAPRSAAETAAGALDEQDYEFIRLQNIGSQPVRLDGVKLTLGVTIDFTSPPSPVVAINPGDSVYAVKNKSGFEQRYGTAFSTKIAGEYVGSLSNSGEQIKLEGPDGADADTLPDVIKDFIYADRPGLTGPWPTACDGDGPSMLLVNPTSNPDHAQGANWVASAAPGGTLIYTAAGSMSYTAWRQSIWGSTAATDDSTSGPDADPDGDGIKNLLEYVFGSSPKRVEVPPLTVKLENIASSSYLRIEFDLSAQATGYTLKPERSTDLINWEQTASRFSGPTFMNNNPNGTRKHSVRSTTPTAASPTREFMRLRVNQP